MQNTRGRKSDRQRHTTREILQHCLFTTFLSMSICIHVLFRVRWHFVDVVFTFTLLLKCHCSYLSLGASTPNHRMSCVCVVCTMHILHTFNFSIYRIDFLYILWLSWFAFSIRPSPSAILTIFVCCL